MSTDQAAEGQKQEHIPGFDQIEAEAAALEGQAAAQAAPVAPPPSTNAADILGAVQLLRVMAKPMFADWPDYEVVWSDRTLQATADSAGAIMDRHGWTLGGIMEQWGPYIALVGAIAPPSLATYQHLKLRRLRAEAEAKAQEGQQGPAS